MTNRDDARDRLTELAGEPVPPPAAEFTDRLDDRLRAVATTIDASGDPAAGAGGRLGSRTPLARGMAVAGSVLVVAALAVGILVSSDDGTAYAQLVSATDAVVTRADGTEVPARAGLVLAEGDTIRTGTRGAAVLGELRLGPEMAATVAGGRLRLVPLDRPGPHRPAPGAPVTVPDVGLDPPPTRPDRPPATQASPRTTAQPPPRDSERELAIDARGRDGVVGLVWSEVRSDRFHAYVILRSVAPDEPRYPAGTSGDGEGGTTVVAVLRERDHTSFVDRSPGSPEPVYRVVAVDRDGNELARSRAVRVVVEGAGTDAPTKDTTGSGGATDQPRR